MKNWMEELSRLPIKDSNTNNTYPLSEAPINILEKIFDTINWQSIER